MPILGDEDMAARAAERAGYRVNHVGTKLNEQEVRDLDTLAKRRNQTQGELIRQLILDELARDSGEPAVSPELIEIIGLRLMLMNLLEPVATGQRMTPETYAGIIAEVKKHKRSLAVQTQTDLERA
jgi:hypothetical protein